ncbi:MAG: GNAT family N-acetyltransferase [Pseudomonadota bacterium]|nr:GNAT family N-acetyltransferase [Pseudomonadota bacterium]
MLTPEAGESDLTFRAAERNDLPAIVGMLADDPLGARRESFSDPLAASYLAAFDAIDVDPNNELVVAVANGEVIGVLQVTFIPCLTYRGGWRALIEGVRVSSNARSSGTGGEMIRWAIERARQRGCLMVQLTTDKTRTDALRFYERLGFVASHHGMKLMLQQPDASLPDTAA